MAAYIEGIRTLQMLMVTLIRTVKEEQDDDDEPLLRAEMVPHLLDFFYYSEHWKGIYEYQLREVYEPLAYEAIRRFST